MQVSGIDRRAHWNSLIDDFYKPHKELDVRQFSTILDFQLFAAIVGYKYKGRVRLEGEKMTIPWRTVENSQTVVELINLMALAASENDAKILKQDNDQERVKIFEEFSEGGFQTIQSWTEDDASDVWRDKIIEKKIIELKNSDALSNITTPPKIDF